MLSFILFKEEYDIKLNSHINNDTNTEWQMSMTHFLFLKTFKGYRSLYSPYPEFNVTVYVG